MSFFPNRVEKEDVKHKGEKLEAQKLAKIKCKTEISSQQKKCWGGGRSPFDSLYKMELFYLATAMLIKMTFSFQLQLQQLKRKWTRS